MYHILVHNPELNPPPSGIMYLPLPRVFTHVRIWDLFAQIFYQKSAIQVILMFSTFFRDNYTITYSKVYWLWFLRKEYYSKLSNAEEL